MGSVWLANHLTLHLRCAIKFMSTDSRVQGDPSFRTRFEFEARAVAQLQSPHVVRILDYAVVEDVPFIAMEYLQGEDLEARLSRVEQLDAQTTYRIVSQVAHGLGKAHAARLVHRDIKPENIFLVAEDNEEEVVKLLDFGVAKSSEFALRDHGTHAGAIIGTPAYMSPEQVRGNGEIDHRSDLWSLAVVAYECLTGQLPFESPGLGEMFAKIMYEPLPVPTSVAPWLTPEFDRWWARAASRKPDDRFSSARELAVALGRALAIPSVASDLSEAGSWANGLTPSVPPLVLTPPPPASFAVKTKPAHLTTTLSAVMGLRSVMRSRRNVLAAAALIGSTTLVGLIAFSSSSSGTRAAAHGELRDRPPVNPVALPRAVDAAPAALAAPSNAPSKLDESSVSVTDLPEAPPVWSAAPASSASSERAPAATPAAGPAPKGARPPAKRSADVDFGI
jgi:serine/threonine-protein kinase